jgi:hypothetical protein
MVLGFYCFLSVIALFFQQRRVAPVYFEVGHLSRCIQCLDLSLIGSVYSLMASVQGEECMRREGEVAVR